MSLKVLPVKCGCSWEWKTLKVNVMVTQGALQWRKCLGKHGYCKVEAGWICLHFCECCLPFCCLWRYLHVVGCCMLLKNKNKNLFPYAASSPAVCIWMSVVRSALFRRNRLRCFVLYYGLWQVASVFWRKKILSQKRALLKTLLLLWELLEMDTRLYLHNLLKGLRAFWIQGNRMNIFFEELSFTSNWTNIKNVLVTLVYRRDILILIYFFL